MLGLQMVWLSCSPAGCDLWMSPVGTAIAHHGVVEGLHEGLGREVT